MCSNKEKRKPVTMVMSTKGCVWLFSSTCLFSLHLQKRGGLKGFVDLSKVKVIEKVQETAFDKPSFQVCVCVHVCVCVCQCTCVRACMCLYFIVTWLF